MLCLLILGALAAGCGKKLEAPVTGGAYVGFVKQYSDRPVVQQTVPLDRGYEAKFWAYDRGDEAHFIVYGQQAQTGEYYVGLVRMTIEDPDGNAFTVYRNTEAEAVDEPIIWKPRRMGSIRFTSSSRSSSPLR